MSRVVCIRRSGGRVVQGCDVYIGRECRKGGWDLPRSKWANPFPVGGPSGRTPEQAVQAYENYMRNERNRVLLSYIMELDGKVLGCWCKKKGTEPCHGDVLIKLLKEAKAKQKKE